MYVTINKRMRRNNEETRKRGPSAYKRKRDQERVMEVAHMYVSVETARRQCETMRKPYELLCKGQERAGEDLRIFLRGGEIGETAQVVR